MDQFAEFNALPDEELEKAMQAEVDRACAEGLRTPRDVPAAYRWFRTAGWMILASLVAAPFIVLAACTAR